MSESDLLINEKPGTPFNSWWSAKRKANSALKQLIESFVSTDATEEELVQLAERLAELSNGLSNDPEKMSFSQLAKSNEHGNTEQISHEINPVMGQSSPLAPPLNVWREDDKFKGKVTFPRQYEGPPNFVHGGFIAATFDQFLGAAQMELEAPGVTGTLNIRYNLPAPLDTELAALAYIDRVEGRKIFMRAELHHGDNLIATSEAIFIRWKDETFEDLG